MNRREMLGAAGLAALSIGVPQAHAAEPATMEEAPLDPQRPIVDPHHHIWDQPAQEGYFFRRFLLSDLLGIIKASGHNITQTVFAECHSMYRADGPEETRCVGETEFINGEAAMSASGNYGPCRVAAGIIGSADFKLGERVKPVLEAQIAAGNGRFRGIRVGTIYADTPIFGRQPPASSKGMMADATFRKAVAQLGPLGLSWDVWCLHPQLGELADAASAVPNTTVVLDHVGSPLNVGPYAGKEKEVFAAWKKGIVELARRPNVVVKLGGLGMDLGVPIGSRRRNVPSKELAATWGPYMETCIAAFGPDRCMFQSNFPPDFATCTYGALWNAFKLIAAKYSESEKAALFGGTAKRVYRLT